jgi:hypothetical protein
MRTGKYKTLEEIKRIETINKENLIKEQSILSSAKLKLEALAEYNRKNHTSLSVYNRTPDSKIDKLTSTEINCVVDKINSDPDVSPLIKNKVATGTIEGSISVNNLVIKYLDTIIKK